MRVAVIQLGYDDAEPMEERVERVGSLVREQAGHDLVVLPELWGPTGFGYGRWEASAQPVDGPLPTAMAAAARDAGVALHAGSFVERLAEPGPDGRTLANTSVLYAADGSLAAVYRKIHRFGFGSGEPKLMEAGDELVLSEIACAGGESVTAGLSTCYDLRFPELYRRQLGAGAEMFVVPAAWPAARVGHWSLLGRARAIENQCVMIQCNTVGTHAGYEMGGCSQVVTASGEILAEGSPTDQQVLSVEIDLGATAAYRNSFPVLADRRL